jgi:glycosidase
VIYEIYPRSFQDTDGDGVGDLNGVTRRLDYLQQLGVDAIWLTPFYPSPNADFGYDVADYTNVAPEYGTLADWDRLVRAARKRGMRILVDLVLNHSSDQHPWFKESRSSTDNPKRGWYVWRNGGADQIGMGDLPDAQLAAAPLGPHRPRTDDRDRERTPMQWSAADGAGFSRGTPWLPVAAAADRYNLERESRDPNSIYSWYAQLIKLRHANAALRDGAYLPLESENPQVFAFARTGAGGAGVLVVFNMSKDEQTAHIRGWPGAPPRVDRELLATPAPARGNSSQLTLAPFGVSIISLRARLTHPRFRP